MRIYILLAMALTTTLSRAVTNMCVETKSGSIYRYDVEHVTEVDYKENVPIDTAVNEAGVPSEDGLSMNGKIGNYSYVDLGLPSGLKWATYNVGASKPTECGDYFAWGETSPKTVFKENNYKLSKDSCKTYTKYTYIDKLLDLEEFDDAATANCGRGWRMPTYDEQTELRSGCTWTWTNNFNGSGVAGRIGTSKTNGNTIFFPAAGYRAVAGLFAVNAKGEYWSSSRKSSTTNAIRTFRFTSSYGGDNLYARFWGLPIRAVGSDTSRNDYYTVRFYDRDSTLIESQVVKWGEKAQSPTAPEITGFEFTGWSDTSFSCVKYDINTYTQYKYKLYTVKFYTDDSVLISSKTALYGYTISFKASDIPNLVGKVFIGWKDSSFVCVKQDLDIYAIYKDGVAESGKKGDYSYVDLGLSSGLKWATYNVGASNTTEYGDNFAWGETSPKEDYSKATYKFSNDSCNTFTKYVTTSKRGIVDSLLTLLPEDDAATANWGEDWRMPTYEEFSELLRGCFWETVDDYNGSGIKVTIGTSKTNGNTILFPVVVDSSNGYYLSSSLSTINSCAESIKYGHSLVTDRYEGNKVRAVVNEEK